ncbi:MAG: bifunctional glycosyltransferase/class I SAM-dependent methyltransferase [Blastocatellia bacterium]
MDKKRILIFIVAYNAEKHIESVLNRIPQIFWTNETYETEVLIIDDASKDNTVEVANKYQLRTNRNIKVLRNPINQRYGGNQKIGYTYAIEQNFDVVALLHGDGQYAPEMLDTLIAPIAQGETDVVFGSRMMEKQNALKGGMPFYKFMGNIILTTTQNLLLKSNLTEFHTGYRIYSVAALKEIPFQYNSNDFDFDTDIIIQVLDNKFRIKEIPIPTHYGDEVCHVNGIKYALQILRTSLLAQVQKFNIYYHPKFDYKPKENPYKSKTDFDSTHSFAIDHIPSGSVVLDFGCASGYIAAKLKEKGCRVYGYDQFFSDEAVKHCEKVFQVNFDNFDFQVPENENKVDYVLLLDVIEHLSDPAQFLTMLRERLAKHRPEIILTTGNIAFVLTRLSLLVGQFNYGRRGILDLTHKRLFTFSSIKQLLKDFGYEISMVEGVPVPIPFVIANKSLANFLLKVNNLLIKLNKGLFSFQIAIIAKPLPTLNLLLENAKVRGQQEYQKALVKSEESKSSKEKDYLLVK